MVSRFHLACVLSLFLVGPLVTEATGAHRYAWAGSEGRTLLGDYSGSMSLDLGVKLYCAKAQDSRTQNLFFSPASIATGLSMVYLGARSGTAEEMKAALGLDAGPEDVNFHMSMGQLSQNVNGGGYSLKSANNLFVLPEQPLVAQFSRTANAAYGITPKVLDFALEPEQSRTEINEWVTTQTEGQIKNMLPTGSVTPETKLVLVNAISFDAQWANEFKQDKTKADAFMVDGKEITVDMMQNEAKYKRGVVHELGAQVLEIPYAENRFSVFILVPYWGENLENFDKQLCKTPSNGVYILSNLEHNMTMETTDLQIPKLDLEADLLLHEVLPSLAVRQLFAEGVADLSGIDGTKKLFVKQALHKATMKMDERGTQAAAATAVSFEFRIAPPIFKADRPFMFFIRDNGNKSIVFMGKIVNPKQ